MITYTEAGISEAQFNAIKDGSLPATHKVIAHRITPDFQSLLDLSGTPPFYSALTDTYLMVTDAAGTLHRYHLLNGTWDTGTAPYSGEIRLVWDETTLHAFSIETGVIKRKTSSDNGATWGVAETVQGAITDYTITKIAPVTAERLHFVAEHNTKAVQHLNMVARDTSSWVKTASDVYYPYPVLSMDAVEFNGNDVVCLDTEIPGEWSAENADLDETAETYWEQTVALIAFTVQNGSEWGYHTVIDKAVRLNNPDDFEGVQAQVINGKLYVTTWATVGTNSISSQHIKAYRGASSTKYTLPDMWKLPNASAAGQVFIKDDKLFYVTTNGEVYVGDACIPFGYDNPALREDISAHIAEAGLSVSRSTMLSATMTLNNFDGYFDNHAIVNDDVPFACDLYITYFVEDSPVDVFLGRVYSDALSRARDGSSDYVTIELRDLLRNATDWYQSEDFDQLAGKTEVSIIPDAADPEATFAHIATVAGTLSIKNATNDGIQGEGAAPHVGLLTFNSNLYAYEFGVTFSAISGQLAGIVIHALDGKNYIYIQRMGGSDVIYVRDGVETVVGSIGFTGSPYPAYIKYGAVFLNDIDPANPDYIIDYSGMTAVNGKYQAASNTPTAGSCGLRFDEDKLTRATTVFAKDHPEEILLPQALDWYFAKAGLVADVLTPVYSTLVESGNSYPILPGANFAQGNQVDPMYDNVFDGDLNTFINYGTIDSVNWTVIGEIQLSSPKALHYMEVYGGEGYSAAIEYRVEYWTGTQWSQQELYSNYEDAQGKNYRDIPTARDRYRISAQTATGTLLNFTVRDIRLYEREAQPAAVFPVSNDSRMEWVLNTSDDESPVAVLAFAGQDFPRYELRVVNRGVSLIYFVDAYTDTLLSTITYSFSMNGSYLPASDCVVIIERDITDTGEKHRISMAWEGQSTYDINEITSQALSGFQAMGATRFRARANSVEVAYTTLDPGETPMGGISRAVDGRYIKMFTRYNGDVRIIEPSPDSPIYTFSTELRDLERVFDSRELYSHVRLLGAYVEGEYVDEDLLPVVGHRFTEANNPYLMTESECTTEAQRLIRRMKETADRIGFSATLNPFLEPEDTVTVDRYGNYILDEISIEFEPGIIRGGYSGRKSISV